MHPVPNSTAFEMHAILRSFAQVKPFWIDTQQHRRGAVGMLTRTNLANVA